MPDLPDDVTWIDDAAGIARVAERMASCHTIYLDTESNSMFAYRERICLIQLNLDDSLWLIDSLALEPGPAALAPLARYLNDPERVVVLHGGEYDVACLKRDYQIAPPRIFDTQQAASMLGFARTGYGALVGEVCDVQLPKAHSQYNWGTRPIDSEALRYAVDDVRYLPTVHRALEAQVVEADLADEVAIANQAVADAAAHDPTYQPNTLWRLKGIRDLPNRCLGLLTALHRWRDEQAAKADVPPGRVLANEPLLQLARVGPTSFPALKRIRLRGWVLRELGDELLTVISDTKDNPPEVPEPPARRELDPATREREKQRESRLKDWRRSEAERRGVPLQVVLPARALEYFKRHGTTEAGAAPQFGDKRADQYLAAIAATITKADAAAARKQR